MAALGHPQTNTPIKTDNSTAAAFVTDTLKNKRSKSWDVRYQWLSEQQANGKFNFYWDKGKNNLADYRTKHHPPSYHQKVREKYILKNLMLQLFKNLDTALKDRKSLHARVCSSPTPRSLCANVPSKLQRLKSRYHSVSPNASTSNKHIIFSS